MTDETQTTTPETNVGNEPSTSPDIGASTETTVNAGSASNTAESTAPTEGNAGVSGEAFTAAASGDAGQADPKSADAAGTGSPQEAASAAPAGDAANPQPDVAAGASVAETTTPHKETILEKVEHVLDEAVKEAEKLIGEAEAAL